MNNVNENQFKEFYKTSDLGLATTISLYFPIITTERINPRKVLFIFDKTDDLNKFIDQYWRGEVVVEPQKFTNQIKSIKDRIYSET